MTESAGVDPMADLSKFAALVGAGLGLALYLQVLKNRFYWVVMETCLGVVSLIVLAFADTMIASYQSTGSNTLALYLFRMMACGRIAQAAGIFLTRNSTDPTVAVGLSITNILTRVALVMCAFHGIYYTDGTINAKHLTFDIVMNCLLIVGDLFQISKVTTREGSLTIGDPVSFHLSVDGLLQFMLACWVFGFPEMFISVMNPNVTPNRGQLALAQVMGCKIIGLAVLSFAALCFKKNEDGLAVLKAKLIFYLPSFLFGVALCITDSQYRGAGHVFAVIVSMAVLGINALFAIWENEKEKMS